MLESQKEKYKSGPFKISVGLTIFLVISFIIRCINFQSDHFLLKSINLIILLLSVLMALLLIYSLYRLKRSDEDLFDVLNAKLDAISRSQAIIEFNMDGNIITANEKFLETLGYTLDEIKGKHHKIFIDEKYSYSEEYNNFWSKLNRGEYIQAEFKRIGKNNKVVWLLSSYSPIFNRQGKPVKVIKVATDITEQKKQSIDLENMSKKLREIGVKIMEESNEISVGVKQLESTVSEQVTSASQQAAAVTQISTTIEQIKATTSQTKEKAKQLGESANITTSVSEKGRQAINLMTTFIETLQSKMQQISATILSLNDKTQQISEITEAVADIAKQSKMLALNASIEAAKAGESGKGFAVVAGEVKDLAERSQQSTERVQKILQDIRQTAEHAVMVTEAGNKSVEENSKQVKLTDEIINSLGNVIEETSIASMQIVSAVREEAIAIEQVDASIKEINKVTNLFSSATEQTKDSTINLSKIADSLKKTASQYGLRELQEVDRR
ncbi:Putative methyl-accepting chemotaxis sensory transducer [Legionella busanensis]|uniref:Methyl-accepting chemotaxis sensory transducer n=1 Tax=Legionella busanensis TaxID=190655 RepID=A0A378JG52_9GAMM|nr:methyl-accepting chemotaxis protein [Legionella busanensis]STX49957.1 Putative methyl-accepting chemotaxis sensory transducer [Legionella busanensis]